MNAFKTKIRHLGKKEQDRTAEVRAVSAAKGHNAEKLRTAGVKLMARVFDVAHEAATALEEQGISASASKENDLTVEFAVTNGSVFINAEVQDARVFVTARSNVRGKGAEESTPPLGDNNSLTDEKIQRFFEEWIEARLDLAVGSRSI